MHSFGSFFCLGNPSALCDPHAAARKMLARAQQAPPIELRVGALTSPEGALARKEREAASLRKHIAEGVVVAVGERWGLHS